MRYLKLVWVGLVATMLVGWGATRSVVAQDPLTESFTSADGSISFQYPADWVVAESGGFIMIANGEASLENDIMEAGEVNIVILPPAKLNEFYADTGEDLLTYFTGFAETVNVTGDTYGEFTPLEVGGFPALQSITASDTADGIMVMVDYPAGRLLVATGHLQGDADLYNPTLFAILDTLTLQPTTPTDAGTPEVLWQVIYGKEESTATGPLMAAVNAIALDPEGYLLYIAAGAGGVTVINADGEVVDTFSPPTVDGVPGNIMAVAAASDGTLWLADVANMRLHQMDAYEGDLLQTVGQSAAPSTPGAPGEFDDLGPTQLHIGPDGRLYVLNQAISGEDRIMIFSADGTFESEFKLPEPLAFGSYGKFALAPDGTLYLSVQEVTTTLHLAVMDTSGNLLREIPLQLPPEVNEYGPLGALVVLEDGTFWATDSFGGMIYHFDAEGTILTAFGQAQSGDLGAPFTPGEFSQATGAGLNGLIVLEDGDVIAGDMNVAYTQVVRIHFGR